MEEKFQKIDDLTKKFWVMKRLVQNPEVTVLLMLDLIEGNLKLKSDKQDERVVITADGEELNVIGKNHDGVEKS